MQGFMDIVRRVYPCKRVKANQVYCEYIRDKSHIHMNSTTWHTLGAFVQYLGREGKVKIDHTDEGWYLTYVDPELEAKRERLMNKVKVDKDDEERMSELIAEQARRWEAWMSSNGFDLQSPRTGEDQGRRRRSVDLVRPADVHRVPAPAGEAEDRAGDAAEGRRRAEIAADR